MKKYIGLFVLLLLIVNVSYAECEHDYVKQYNYSSEITAPADQHYYRQKCNKCGDIIISEETNYEYCNYVDSKCTICGMKQCAMPQYNIALEEKSQEKLYELCKQYDIMYVYESLLSLMYSKSQFNPNLQNGIYSGLFQINSAYDYSWLIGRSGYDLLNPLDNIEIGVALYNYYTKNNYGLWSIIIALNSGVSSEEMIEYKSETDMISNSEIVNKIFNMKNNLKKNYSF